MKKVKIVALVTGVGLLLGSCMTSNNVVSNKLISKRKYTKGFFINNKANFKSDKVDENEELALGIVPTELTNAIDSRGVRTKDVASIESKNNSELITSSVDQKTVLESRSNSVASSIAETTKTTESKELMIGDHKISDIKQVLKEKSTTSNSPIDDTAMLIILVILAIIIPPLAVGLYEGITTRFWIDLILAIVGWGVGFWLIPHLAFLCGLAAIIYALLIVLEVI